MRVARHDAGDPDVEHGGSGDDGGDGGDGVPHRVRVRYVSSVGLKTETRTNDAPTLRTF